MIALATRGCGYVKCALACIRTWYSITLSLGVILRALLNPGITVRQGMRIGHSPLWDWVVRGVLATCACVHMCLRVLLPLLRAVLVISSCQCIDESQCGPNIFRYAMESSLSWS